MFWYNTIVIKLDCRYMTDTCFVFHVLGSGWSVYCREHTQDKQLSPGSFSALVKELGQSWRNMTPDDRADYHSRAEHENCLKADLLASPLPTKAGKNRTDIQKQAEKDKGFRKFLIRSKPKRSLLNQKNFNQSQAWQSHGLGLADCHSALRFDLYDQTSGLTHPSECLKRHLHNDLSPLPACEPPSSCHDQTCGVIYGQCVKNFKNHFAQLGQNRLVEHALNAKLKNGTCLAVQVENNVCRNKSDQVLLLIGAIYKKPASIVVIRLYQLNGVALHSLLGGHPAPTFVVGAKFLDDLIRQIGVEPTHLRVAVRRFVFFLKQQCFEY